jgi:hypothetical protein
VHATTPKTIHTRHARVTRVMFTEEPFCWSPHRRKEHREIHELIELLERIAAELAVWPLTALVKMQIANGADSVGIN